jgi:hypothetical protein
MSVLPLTQAVERFRGNEDRIDIFTNGSSTDTYTTRDGRPVPSVTKFLLDMKQELIDAASQLVIGDQVGKSAITVDGSTRLLEDWLRVVKVDNTVRDFGALMNGANDTAAFQNARNSTPVNTVVKVPPGQFNANIPVDATRTVLWQLAGNCYGDTTTPVFAIGSDIVETFLQDNGKYISRGATTTKSGSMMTLRSDITHVGGPVDGNGNATGGVIDALKVSTTLKAGSRPDAFIFNLTGGVYDESGQTNPNGNYVGVYAQAFRVNGGTPLWAFASETISYTNKTSSQEGALLGAEVLLKTNRADDADKRVVLDVVLGKGLNDAGGTTYEQAEVLAFVRASNFFGDVNQGHGKFGFLVDAAISDAAFSAEKADFVGARGVALRTGNFNYIDLSGDSSKMVRWNGNDGFEYTYFNEVYFGVTNSGTTKVRTLNIRDQAAPNGRNDQMGAVNDFIFTPNGKLYAKTTSGWILFTSDFIPA